MNYEGFGGDLRRIQGGRKQTSAAPPGHRVLTMVPVAYARTAKFKPMPRDGVLRAACVPKTHFGNEEKSPAERLLEADPSRPEWVQPTDPQLTTICAL